MNSRNKEIYVLGTGLSHDGSACLLRNGEICVAIEKERITRIKHDGFNDSAAINYCLQAEGISINDVSLVVQNANFGFFEYGNSYFSGARIFKSVPDLPIVTISHHLAHAFYAIGSSPFKETAVLVMDGCGSLYDECLELKNTKYLPQNVPAETQHLYAEKDSFYLFSNNELTSVYKDFSPYGYSLKNYPLHPPTTQHSIGGLYSAVSLYCFQSDSDSGKLMGLAPYGRPGIYSDSIFELKDGRVLVNYDWMRKFDSPAFSEKMFWENFQYYADIAYWVQKETERAILYIVQSRAKMVDCGNLSYTGGVALNAVANALIVEKGCFSNYYFTPAAGDNGLAIGCAYYGWLEVLKKQKIVHRNNSCYGRSYGKKEIKRDIDQFIASDDVSRNSFLKLFFTYIGEFVDSNAAYKEKYVIRIVITDAGIYNLQLNRDNVSILQDLKQNPDCTLVTDFTSLINGLSDNSYLLASSKDNKSLLTGDIDYFMGCINLEKLIAHIKTLQARNPNIKKLSISEETDVIKRTAELLAGGKIIGWFQDGCEFGPRALGHRSILADPRKTGVRKFINNKIKFREDFRPFAPTVLKEKANEYFELDRDSPYMLLITKVKENIADKIPGVVHVDGSARVQTITPEMDQKYYSLIAEFEALTGIPILLNTSFNKRGMPIIETPSQALAYFFECGLDCLVLGDYIVYKNEKDAHFMNRSISLIENL
ncbi:MAG TPA: carbamoyltransferase C-terminal domain-containing protein [Puia sp.]|nr:carbamoyltransferase C-terminal domain-containing protein [Puia sp.]